LVGNSLEGGDLPKQYQNRDVDEYEEAAERSARNLIRSRKAKPKRASEGLLRGIVVRARGHHYDVTILSQEGRPGGEQRMCEVRGRLLQDRGRDTLVAVGDTVWILPIGTDRGQIERVEERHSVLSRQHPGVAVRARPMQRLSLALIRALAIPWSMPAQSAARASTNCVNF
jgi:hypothetical protein